MVSGTIPLDTYFGSTSASASKSKGPGPRIGNSGRNSSTGNSKSSTSPVKKRKRNLHTDDEEYEVEGKVRSGSASKKGKCAQVPGGAGNASPLKVTRNGSKLTPVAKSAKSTRTPIPGLSIVASSSKQGKARSQNNGPETVYPTPKSTTISRHLRSSPSIEFPEKLSATITGLATPSTAPRPKPKPRPVPKPMSPLKGKGRVTAVRSPRAKSAYTVKAWTLPASSMTKDPDDDMDVIEVSSSDPESDGERITLPPISTLHGNHDHTRSEPHIRTSSPLTPVPSSRSPSEDVHRLPEALTTPVPVKSPTTSTSDSYIVTPTQLRFVPSSQPTQDYGRKYPDRHTIESETESESDSEDEEENPFAARRRDNHRGGGGGCVGSTANSKTYHLPRLSSPPESSSSQAASVFTPAPESNHRHPPTSASGPATVDGPSTSPYKVPRIPAHSERIWSSPASREGKDEDLEVVPSSQSQSQRHYLTIPRDHNITFPERKMAPGTSGAPIQTTTESGNSSQHPIDWYEVVPSSQSQEIEMQLPEGWHERQAQAPVASSSSRTSPPKEDAMEVHLSSPDISPIRPSSLPQPSSSQDSYSSIDIPHLHSTPPPPGLKPASKTHSYSVSQDRSLSSSAKRKLQIRDINLHHADLSNFAPDSQPQRKLVNDQQQQDSETEEESEEDEEGQYHVYPAPPEMTPTPPSPPRRSISPPERLLRTHSPSAARASPSSLEPTTARSPRPTDPSRSEVVGSTTEAGPSTTRHPSRTPTSPSADPDDRMRHKVYRSLVRYTAKARAGTQSQYTQFTQSEVDGKPKFDLKAEMKKLGLDLDNDLDMEFDSQQALEGGFSIPEDMEMLELSDEDDDDEGERHDGGEDWNMGEKVG